jgi:phosphomannomutase/phosphoglucomutase
MSTLPTDAIDPAIFRAYDIRGIAGETLTEPVIFLIGKALGSLLLEQNEKKLYAARDGRLSGPVLFDAFIQGVLSTGCDVISVGMIPTPLLYFAAHLDAQASGAMLTGSHNPKEYNGLKIIIKGQSLTETGIQQLYERILEKKFFEGLGQISELNIIEPYEKHFVKNIQLSRPLKIVVDAGNGIMGKIAPVLYRALGCTVHELYCEIDGHFPHHHPDPSDPNNLQALIHAVRDTKADIGLAFDGDGDRLGVVTARGKIIWPDRLLMLFAQDILTHTSTAATIIYDVKCTHHLEALIQSLGGKACMWKTGHSFIKRKMTEIGAQLGGEMSGHFFFKDRWYGFDDASYAGARLLEILSNTHLDSDSIFDAIPNSMNTPELKITVADKDKFQLIELLSKKIPFHPDNILTIDGVRVNFQDGWGLIRASNTTPYLITRFEAINQLVLEQIQQLFREWILSVKPDLVLPF